MLVLLVVLVVVVVAVAAVWVFVVLLQSLSCKALLYRFGCTASSGPVSFTSNVGVRPARMLERCLRPSCPVMTFSFARFIYA